MIDDARTFLLVVLALYLIECVGIAARVAVYVDRGRRGVRVRGAATGFGPRGRALDLGNPLALGRVRLAVPLVPLSISADGVLAYALHAYNPGPRVPAPGVFVPFDGGGPVRADGGDLRAGGRLAARLGSERAARAWAARLTRVRAVAPDRRAGVVREILREHVDAEAVAERVAVFDRAVRPLELLSPAILAFLVVGLPAIVALRGLAASWPWLLGVVVALQAAVVVAVLRARRLIARSFAPPDPMKMVAVALSPFSAARAADVIGRDLLADFHPLAVVAALGTGEETAELAGRVLRDLRTPYAAAPSLEDPRGAGIARGFADDLASALSAMLRLKGHDPDALAALPPGLAPPGTPICPRCATVYAGAGVASCSDCGGLALVPAP